MFRRLSLLLALGLSGPAGAWAQQDADPVIAALVANAQAMIGTETGSMRITAVRGEGRTLILGIELPSTAPEALGPAQVASITAAGLCSNARAAALFRDGRSLRVEVTRAGRPIGTGSADRCPGPIGEGMSAATFAGGLQSFIGMEFGGVTIAAVRAEGNLMIVTLDTSPTLRAGAPQNFLQGFCQRPDVQTVFFGNGLVLRVDTTIAGRDLERGSTITSCPGR